MAVAPETSGTINAAALNQDLALEVLRQAQETIKAQLAAGDSPTTKLTTVSGQSVSLSLAVFGAAALAFTAKSWLPPWAAVGLFGAGLVWVATAAGAVMFGLRPQDWMPPAFEPKDLWKPEIMNPPSTASGYAYIAAALQDAITTNRQQNTALARMLIRLQVMLISAVWLGLLAGASAITGAHILAWILARRS